jgi:hypothetical protein
MAHPDWFYLTRSPVDTCISWVDYLFFNCLNCWWYLNHIGRHHCRCKFAHLDLSCIHSTYCFQRRGFLRLSTPIDTMPQDLCFSYSKDPWLLSAINVKEQSVPVIHDRDHPLVMQALFWLSYKPFIEIHIACQKYFFAEKIHWFQKLNKVELKCDKCYTPGIHVVRFIWCF